MRSDESPLRQYVNRKGKPSSEYVKVKYDKPAKETEKLGWEKHWERENVMKVKNKEIISRSSDWSAVFIAPLHMTTRRTDRILCGPSYDIAY